MFPKCDISMPIQRSVRVLACSLGLFGIAASAAVVDVQVGPSGSLSFNPSTVQVHTGDTVRWTWASSGHSVTSGSSCSADATFGSTDTRNVGNTYEFTFNNAGSFAYFCNPHCAAGMTGVVKVTAGSSASNPLKGVKKRNQITIPADDRFTPFSLTIRAGDKVAWINNDTDDHTVVSDDIFNKGMGKKQKGIDQIVKGTDSNGGESGVFVLRFPRAGTFVYHCRIHSHVDDAGQPVAPGPGEDPANPTASGIQGNDGGIPNTPDGNYGTPMMGVITVLPPS